MICSNCWGQTSYSNHCEHCAVWSRGKWNCVQCYRNKLALKERERKVKSFSSFLGYLSSHQIQIPISELPLGGSRIVQAISPGSSDVLNL